jgi:3-oxosteroid 1-dehydrogenase
MAEGADEHIYDFVIVGSGGGSSPAALTMKASGKSVLIIEKLPHFGGSSAYSGGVIWIPNNHHIKDAGGHDSPELSRQYLDSVVGDVGPASTPARRDAFIKNGPEMVDFLESKGMKFMHAYWPDYYSALPGGLDQGRSLVAPLFNVNELGEWRGKLARHMLTTSMPVTSRDAVHLNTMALYWRGRWVVMKSVAEAIKNVLLGRDKRGAGNAIQGRLYQIVLREGIPIWLDSPVKDLIVEDGRVAGVVAQHDGKTVRVRARLGVLVNAGGFARNQAMRDQYQPQPSNTKWTEANPGDTGEMIETAHKLGAAIDLMNEAVWQASTFDKDGNFVCMHSPNDIGKPHCIVVGKNGKRFANENCSYMEFGQRSYAAGAVPAWAILESRHRNRYTWGMYMPGMTPQKAIDDGYFKKADTIADLARQCGIDPQGLEQEVAKFNDFARTGVDKDFHRGESAYNRYYGDPGVKPNPTLGAIERGPFYAVAIWPGDVGTMGGLITDENARVLREDGSVIPGLYACGNSTASVVGRSYPGAGATVGPSMVFGYIAAKHASGSNSLQAREAADAA